MPRRKSLLPKYGKHKQSGQARVTINGRDYLLGRYGSKASELEYDRLITEYVASGRSPTFGVPGGKLEQVTMAMVMVDFLKHCVQYYGNDDKSETRRVMPLLKQLRKMYADLPAADFGPKHLNAFRQAMVENPKNCRNYINASVKRIVRMMKWAASEEMVPAAIYATLRLVPTLGTWRPTISVCRDRSTNGTR